MVLLEVYSKNLKDRYKTTLFSKTTLFAIILTTVKVVVPFLLAYRSKGLWLKRDVFYEQPEVKFRGEYIILALTTDPSHPIFCTSLPEMYDATKNYNNCSIIKVKEIDSNLDGKMDKYFFNTVINKAEKTEIIFLTVIIMVDYTLHTVCSLHMQSAIIFQQAVNPLLTNVEVNGDLRLNQIAPLLCHYRFKNNQYNYSMVSTQNKDNVAEILTEYNRRNLSTHLTNIYTSNSFDDQSHFTLKVNVRYPEDAIYYRPGFWQIIKWAWIQYFAIYIVCAWFIRKVERYIFENRLVLCYISTVVKEKNR